MNNEEVASNSKWLYDSPVYSDVEAKLRHFLVELGNAGKIYGIQICAYKDGQVIIDTAAGVMGKDDRRPVQPDTLFPVFSVTKGVVAGMVHWLVDKGKLKLDENVANFWPEFGTNGKDQIKVNHILNHTSGLHNALHETVQEKPLFCDFDGCVKRIEKVTPETEPGQEQIYHSLSYGWLCGGIIEHASGKKFQEILEEAFIRPLNIEGELYIKIPSGLESRLATSSMDKDELRKFDPNEHPEWTDVASTFTINMLSNIMALLNSLEVRCSTIPAGGGNFSARALARYYAALVDGGVVPPPHPNSPLKEAKDEVKTKIFNTPKEKLHDAFLGCGDYENLALPNTMFGLGFTRYRNAADGSFVGFGHAGLGGSTGYCDIKNRFAIVVNVNKMDTGALTGEIVKYISSELDLVPPIGYGSALFEEKPKIH